MNWLLLCLAARALWQVRPSLLSCALFWTAVAWDYVSHPRGVGSAIAGIGIVCNALVTLANRGFMPFADSGPCRGQSFSLWRRSEQTPRRLLFLADNFWGFSIGDFFLIASMPISVLFVWIGGGR